METYYDTNNINSTIKELEEEITNHFILLNFEDFWHDIDTWYKNYGFTDELRDSDKIAEYKWINDQFTKYVFKHQDQLLSSSRNYKAMLDKALEQRAAKGKAIKERKDIVYYKLKNIWLEDLIAKENQIITLIEQSKEMNNG